MAGITLKSLAARLGVHPSLISRVLRNDPKARLSEKRRREILAAVKESGYRPDHAGRALRNRRSSIVALAKKIAHLVTCRLSSVVKVFARIP